jgi:hypothetical protein
MRDKLNSAKNHVIQHRAKYATVATATVAISIMYRNAREWNEFFKEQGVYAAAHSHDC